MATAGASVRAALALAMALLSISAADAHAADLPQRGLWRSLIDQSRALGLPVRFLQVIPPDFVRFEFEDLRAFAAEYHPEGHRMILNRTLSFNAAAGAIKPLKTLSPRDLSTLYHELLHVYLDYLATPSRPAAAGEAGDALRHIARDQQQCRYQVVMIAPIKERKAETDLRLLSERESWEALNETWAVFVGWAVWMQRELPVNFKKAPPPEAWLTRLRTADRQNELAGYYEPEDSAERAVARKRYLGLPSRISPAEVGALLRWVLEASPGFIDRSVAVMDQNRQPVPGSPPCETLG